MRASLRGKREKERKKEEERKRERKRRKEEEREYLVFIEYISSLQYFFFYATTTHIHAHNTFTPRTLSKRDCCCCFENAPKSMNKRPQQLEMKRVTR
jgi:hypothetical protein